MDVEDAPCPEVQSWQKETDDAPAVEGLILPTGQKVHSVAASVLTYFPVEQSTQVEARVEPVLALYFPVVQAVHSPRAAYSVLSKGLG